MALGWGALLVIGAGILFGIGLVATSMNRGGDAVIAGMTFAVVASVGLAAAALLTLGIGAVQGRAAGRPIAKAMLTALVDPVLVGLISWMFLSLVIGPMHRTGSDALWKAELDRRERLAELEQSIPEQYRNIPPEMIDQHNQMRRQLRGQGAALPPLVPPETERRMRELAILKSRPYRGFDLESYRRIEEIKRDGLVGLGVGWLVGAFVVPLGFLVRMKSPSS